MDAARAIELLADSNIGAGILRTRASEIAAAMNGDPSGPAAFDVDTMRKDLRYMAEEANAHGSALPLANRTLECFDRASYEGGGGVDSVAYPAYWIARQQAVANGRPRPAANGIRKETWTASLAPSKDAAEMRGIRRLDRLDPLIARNSDQ
jgi:hypothetical protein